MVALDRVVVGAGGVDVDEFDGGGQWSTAAVLEAAVRALMDPASDGTTALRRAVDRQARGLPSWERVRFETALALRAALALGEAAILERQLVNLGFVPVLDPMYRPQEGELP
jgi:hypothetical protein